MCFIRVFFLMNTELISWRGFIEQFPAAHWLKNSGPQHWDSAWEGPVRYQFLLTWLDVWSSVVRLKMFSWSLSSFCILSSARSSKNHRCWNVIVPNMWLKAWPPVFLWPEAGSASWWFSRSLRQMMLEGGESSERSYFDDVTLRFQRNVNSDRHNISKLPQ